MEPVEKLEKKQEKYDVERGSFDCRKTLKYLTDGENRRSQKRLNMTLTQMDEDEATLIGEAVASHPFLEELIIKLDSAHDEDEVLYSPMDRFLEAAFLREKHNTSVGLSLFIAPSHVTDGDSHVADGDMIRLGFLSRVVRKSTRISQLSIKLGSGDRFSLAETHDILEDLRSNSTIESLALPKLDTLLEFPELECEEAVMHETTLKRIVYLVRGNKSIQKLQIHIGECRPAAYVNLDAFYTALLSNSAIRILHLTGPFYTQVAESEFSEWIRKTKTLKELRLDGKYLHDQTSMLKVLLKALEANRSLSTLSLDQFHVDKDFIKVARGHPTIREIFLNSIKCDFGKKPGILRLATAGLLRLSKNGCMGSR